MKYGTVDLPPMLSETFGRRLLRYVRDLPFGANAVFLHAIRGSKAETRHHPLHDGDVSTAVDDFFNWVSDREDNLRDWWVDVGMEIQLDGHVLQWRTDAHERIVQQAAGCQTLQEARRLKGSGRYHVDTSAQLTELSGFRLDIKDSRRRKVVYINCYTTDKSATYLHDNGRFAKYTTPEELLLGDYEKAKNWLSSLQRQFNDAIDKVNGHARLEVRTKFDQALNALRHTRELLPAELGADALVAIPRKEWWSFKAIRLYALGAAVRWQREASAPSRSSENAISLTSKRKRDSKGCAAHIEVPAEPEEEDEGEFSVPTTTKPHMPCGMFFIRGVALPPRVDCPRLTNGRSMDNRIIERIFGLGYSQLKLTIHPIGKESRDGLPGPDKRPNNKRPFTRTARVPKAARAWMEFDLEETGAALPPESYDLGDDLDDADHHIPSNAFKTIDELITTIYRQFLSDILQKAPAPKSHRESSYCKLGELGRIVVEDDRHYKNLQLSDIWRCCRIRIAGEDEWKNVFERLFPQKATV
ncbi:hypothetical protein A0H81_02879 [Grifola frondosa]|uniref:Uncharacterized protein n=1 Tax=Grifola frondosa TaxID=5627 RepID=A0A1C7MNJ1_GRIFR|nr:hypothetical protein A0H81_02879 [Grifola frondosa]